MLVSDIATTTVSSRGQVVIPEAVRRKLGLEPGTQLVVIGEGDTIVLKRLEAPRMSDFDDVVKRARSAARRAGMKRTDIADAIAAVRSR